MHQGFTQEVVVWDFDKNQPLEGRTHCNQADTHLRGVAIIRDGLKEDKRQKGKDLNREGSLKRGCRSGDLWPTGNRQRANFPRALREQNRPRRWVFPLDNAQQAQFDHCGFLRAKTGNLSVADVYSSILKVWLLSYEKWWKNYKCFLC